MISILHVDDEPAFLELTRTFLEMQGDILVDGAPSTLEAIEMLKRHPYDAIVSDYQMPGMDGLKFLAHARSRYGEVPFILFTGKGREEVAIQALNGGVDFYLQKGGEAKAQFAELAHKIRLAVEKRKRAEALSLAEFSVDHATILTLWSDENGRIIKANAEASRLLGYSQAELLAMSVWDIDLSTAPERTRQVWEELERKKKYSGETKVRRKDGRLVPIHITSSFLEMNGKKYIFAFAWDVTESKNAEQALRESEERFRTLVESANSFIIKVDPEGRITYANEYALRFFGFEGGGLIGERALGSLVPVTDSEGGDLARLYAEILSDPEGHSTSEFESARKDGSRVWVAWTNKAVRDPDGRLREVLSIGNDITPLKQAEMEMRLSQTRLIEAQRMGRLGDFQYEWTPDRRIADTHWSEEARRILGLEESAQIMTMEDLKESVHPEDRGKWLAALDKAMAEWQRVQVEYRVTPPDGQLRHVLAAYQATAMGGGKVRFTGTIQDITDLKKAETALRLNERRYHMLADLLPDYMLIADSLGKISFVNAGLAGELGKAPSDLVDSDISDLFSHDLAERMRADIVRVMQTGAPLRTEMRMEASGSTRWMDVAMVPIQDADGRPEEVVLASRDITGLKAAEERLAESVASYRALAENMPGLVYRIHLRDGERIQFFNDMLSPMTGYPPDELERTGIGYMEDLVEAADRPMVFSVMKEAVSLGKPFEVEYRVRRKDGRVAHVSQRGRPIRGSDGLPLFIDGVIIDVTERRRSEEAVRESERRFRELADLLPALVFETDANGELTFINETARVMVGHGREDLTRGLKVYELLRPEERERAKAQIERVYEGQPCEGEAFDVVRQDGTSFPATIHCVAVRREGEVVGLRGLFVDVSALRESEHIQEVVHTISQAAISDITLEELYGKIHATLRNLLPLDNFYMALYDEENDELSFPYFVDAKDPNPGPRRRGKGITEYVLRTNELLHLDTQGVEALSASGEIEVIGTPPVEFLAVPLMMKGRIIGLMTAQSYDPSLRFTPKHEAAMRFVSGHVALAIQRKRQEMELQRYASLLRTTFDSTNDGLLIVDAKGHVLALNDRFAKMWCIPDTILRTREDDRMLGFVTDQLADPEGFVARVKELYADLSLTSFDVVRFKDGRVFERYSQPFLLAEDIAGRIWSYRDITARAMTEEALNKSERELKYIVNSAKDAIFVKDPDGRFSMANEAMGALFNVPPAEVTGLRDEDLFDATTAEANARTDQEVLQGRTVEEEVVWNIDGSAYTFSLVKVPLRNGAGDVFGICGIARDTTERRKVEKALKDANESLNLLSSITRHDVLNQLMVIRGYSDLVRAALKDQKLLDYMDKVERATRNIRQQILFTRDFQRLGVAQPKWQSVEELLDKALTGLEAERLDITVDLAGLELLADPMLEKVFYNFIDNTLRHGEKATRISVSCNRQGNDLLLVYEDDGEGVKQEEKERIFERGFGRNTGLGLFLVRLILKVTGIDVREVGEYSKGVRFELLVPDGAYRFREWDDSGA